MKSKLLLIITAILLTVFPIVSFGQAPTLGATSHFALFTAGGAFTSNGATVVTGDIASYTDIPVINVPGSIIGTIYGVGTASDPAFADVSIAFSNFGANGTVLGTPLETFNTTGFINPGTYHTIGAAAMNGNFTLDALGDPNAIFVININGTLTVGAGFNILLANNAQYCNVYWQIKGDFILGAGSVFRGTIISNGAITLNAGSNLYGRALTTAGAITLHNNIVSFTPAAAGTITGTLAQCPATAGQTYSITAVAGATTYTWLVPTGWSVTAGAGTNSITVTTGAIGQNGNITVTAGNSCGTSAASSLAVTSNLSLVASVSIAAVPSGAICAGTSVTFTATPTNGGVPTYQWKSGGADIVGATNSTYTSAALVNTEAITVAMTSTLACASGSPATSNTVTMVVNPVLPASVT